MAEEDRLPGEPSGQGQKKRPWRTPVVILSVDAGKHTELKSGGAEGAHGSFSSQPS